MRFEKKKNVHEGWASITQPLYTVHLPGSTNPEALYSPCAPFEHKTLTRIFAFGPKPAWPVRKLAM